MMHIGAPLMAAMVLMVAHTAQAHSYSERNRPNIDVSHYPLEHMEPVIGNYFSGNVTSNTLTCFGNRDVEECSYLHTFVCMLPGMRVLASNWVQCDSLWGSRSVVVQVQGNVEFLQMSDLPEESGDKKKKKERQLTSTASIIKEIELSLLGASPLKATRWLEIQSVMHSDRAWKKEIKHVPSEPFYLCARSNDWQGSDSRLRVEFRPTYLREQDYNWVIKKTLVHISLVVAVSSLWLLPYIAALVVCIVTYIMGFDYYLATMVFSGVVVCLTPLMLTRKNRHLAKLYLRYFFQKNQAKEVRQLMRERLPVFQALYFSCAAMCIGSVGAFVIYSYFGIDREFRNTLYKGTMAMSAAWLIFFLCRTFERFFRQWSWVVMTLVLTQLLELHLNPASREEALVAIMMITFAAETLLVPNIDLNARIGRDLRGVFWLEQSLMNMPRTVGPRRGLHAIRRQRSREEWGDPIPLIPADGDDSGAGLSVDLFGMSSEGEGEGDGDGSSQGNDEETSGDGLSIDDGNVETPPRQSKTTSVNVTGGVSGSCSKERRSDTPVPSSPAPVYHITVNLTVNSPTPVKEAGQCESESDVAAQVEEAVRRAVGATQESE